MNGVGLLPAGAGGRSGCVRLSEIRWIAPVPTQVRREIGGRSVFLFQQVKRLVMNRDCTLVNPSGGGDYSVVARQMAVLPTLGYTAICFLWSSPAPFCVHIRERAPVFNVQRSCCLKNVRVSVHHIRPKFVYYETRKSDVWVQISAGTQCTSFRSCPSSQPGRVIIRGCINPKCQLS